MSTLRQLLAARRSPGGASPWASLPPDYFEVLQVASGDHAAMASATAATGARPAELRAVALEFVRARLRTNGATLYERLGVAPDAAIEQIRDHYRELISVFHPDRMRDVAQAGDADLAAAINEAWNTLKHPESRAKYDRLRAAPAPSVIRVAPERAYAAKRERRVNAAEAWHPRWKAHREQGRFVVWLKSRTSATLKAMAMGGVLALAVLAVLFFSAGNPTMLAPDALADARPVGARRLLPDPAALASVAAAAHEASSVGAGHEAAGLSAPADAVRITVFAAAPASVGMSEQTLSAAPARTDLAAATTKAAIASPRQDERAASPTPAAVVAPRTVPAPIAASAAAVDAATLAPPASPPEPSRPAAAAPATLPSAVEIDAVVARFAAAFDAGDFAALRTLIDPEVAGDDRMVQMLAGFSRVFAESTSRHIALAVIERTAHHEYASIRLAARTTLNDREANVRVGTGDLTLTLRHRAGVSRVTDIRYVERPAGAQGAG